MHISLLNIAPDEDLNRFGTLSSKVSEDRFPGRPTTAFVAEFLPCKLSLKRFCACMIVLTCVFDFSLRSSAEYFDKR